MFKKINSRKKKGFTLIEMVIVLFIIGMLMLLILPNLSQQKDKATENSNEAFRTTLQTQVDLSETSKIDSLESLQKNGLITQKQHDKADKLQLIVKNGRVVDDINSASKK
ncbi:competence type IV pilus major pilin ComGC [Companilactobacillus mishanensis]|uniref:Prepilin-type N-terminal cleavage/methylation domain-containing protein n=1 Tax=Companilactobacillus mishanensis TaxID=2486008 RepID=A0ABW9P888_9LACO|nr:competence type IV pilus major pilin ComGC [Companilactobacillus mishanensis]MQS45368.1 prepilin-type N-terminal cleavage/methylation domain-containing protein [Companilactobacillus mishanensis]